MNLTDILKEHQKMLISPLQPISYEINSYYNRRLYRLATSLQNQKEALDLITHLLRSTINVASTYYERFYHFSTIIKVSIYFISCGIIAGNSSLPITVKKKINNEKCAINRRLIHSTDHISKLYLRNRLEFLNSLKF